MPGELTISLSSETLESGSREERATFGLLTLAANDRLLTAVEDAERRELRHGPHLPGYPLAEWFAWNWWRLRWELGRPQMSGRSYGWNFAHRMSSVGEGFSWPNVLIWSDGMRSVLVSEPTRDPATVLYRYIGGAGPQTIAAPSLEAAVDGFVEDILTRLGRCGLGNTSLHRVWRDVANERSDPDAMRFRRLEAQLGYDPDEADENAIRCHLADAARFGDDAWSEVAADAAFRGRANGGMVSADEVARAAERSGFDADPNDAITLDEADAVPRPGTAEAWRVGQRMAHEIRLQERMDGRPISDARLADLVGTTADAVSEIHRHWEGMSFAMESGRAGARIALRSKWESGRRFELARLLGDRILERQITGSEERLFPATRAYSYRQKMQRAFAAELLSPFAAVEESLAGDYSEERQAEVANVFRVSPLTIQTQLVNRRRIDRRDAPDVIDRGVRS